MSDELSPMQRTEIQNAIFSGQKIEAIKLYREATGRDLKDSKEAVERLEAELRRQDPARFAAQRRQRAASAAWIFWAAIIALVAYVSLSGF